MSFSAAPSRASSSAILTSCDDSSSARFIRIPPPCVMNPCSIPTLISSCSLFLHHGASCLWLHGRACLGVTIVRRCKVRHELIDVDRTTAVTVGICNELASLLSTQVEISMLQPLPARPRPIISRDKIYQSGLELQPLGEGTLAPGAGTRVQSLCGSKQRHCTILNSAKTVLLPATHRGQRHSRWPLSFGNCEGFDLGLQRHEVDGQPSRSRPRPRAKEAP